MFVFRKTQEESRKQQTCRQQKPSSVVEFFGLIQPLVEVQASAALFLVELDPPAVRSVSVSLRRKILPVQRVSVGELHGLFPHLHGIDSQFCQAVNDLRGDGPTAY